MTGSRQTATVRGWIRRCRGSGACQLSSAQRSRPPIDHEEAVEWVWPPAGDGASVLVHSWSAHDARQAWGAGPDGLVEEIRTQGGRAERAPADLADPEAPARSVTAARKAFGHLDVVVANHSRSSMQNLEQLTATEIGPSYAVNTGATLLLVQAYAAQHDGRPGGRVVVSTSGQYHGAMPSCPTSLPRAHCTN